MDPELLKQRQAFMKKARENLNVSKPINKRQLSPILKESQSSSSNMYKVKKNINSSSFEYKAVQQPNNTTTSKFAIVTRFMKYMKERHLQGDDHLLTVDEALDEMNERSTQPQIVKWLVEEALPKNPKIEIINNRYRFKPKYDIRNRKELRALLEDHFQTGKGNIPLNEIKECYAEAEKHVNKLGELVHKFVRSTDKEMILSANIPILDFEPLAEKDRFRQIFHTINVDTIPNQKIEEFLKHHEFGIISGDSHISNTSQLKRPSGTKRKRKVKLRSNAHMESILEDYGNHWPMKPLPLFGFQICVCVSGVICLWGGDSCRRFWCSVSLSSIFSPLFEIVLYV